MTDDDNASETAEDEVVLKTDNGSADEQPKRQRGRPKINKSPTASVWTIKGISHETRSKVSAAAKRSKETIGAYVDRVLLDAATSDLSSKNPSTDVGPTQHEINDKIINTITELSKKVDGITERVNVPPKSFWKRFLGN